MPGMTRQFSEPAGAFFAFAMANDLVFHEGNTTRGTGQ
jgi:hypothetical protein